MKVAVEAGAAVIAIAIARAIVLLPLPLPLPLPPLHCPVSRIGTTKVGMALRSRVTRLTTVSTITLSTEIPRVSVCTGLLVC
jgi:hypothetical protein